MFSIVLKVHKSEKFINVFMQQNLTKWIPKFLKEVSPWVHPKHYLDSGVNNKQTSKTESKEVLSDFSDFRQCMISYNDTLTLPQNTMSLSLLYLFNFFLYLISGIHAEVENIFWGEFSLDYHHSIRPMKAIYLSPLSPSGI